PGPACPGARAWPDRPSGRDEASGPDDGRESRVGAALTAGAVMTRTQTLHVAATTYTSRTLAVRGIPGDDVAAWSALAHRAAEPNVFFEPEFLLPTVSSFDPDGGVRLLVVERAGEWVAVMPYEMVPGDRHWPRRHASNDGPVLNQVTSLGSPLLAAADPDAAAATLVAALRAHAR